MTYLTFLLVFLLPPILIVYSLLWRLEGRRSGLATLRPVLVMALVALVYTTPWDNYLVANRIWWYRPDWVLGATLAWVPVEEYAFFILQTIFTGGWTLLVIRRVTALDRVNPRGGRRLRWAAGLAAAIGWIVSLGVLLVGRPQLTYVALILVWGLPPLVLQAAFGADLLWQRAWGLLLSIGLPSIYLILADALAIRAGTWVINPSFSLSTRVAGFPLEEALFFVVTNSLVAVGLGLWSSAPGRARALGWLDRLRLNRIAESHPPANSAPLSPSGGSHERV